MNQVVSRQARTLRSGRFCGARILRPGDLHRSEPRKMTRTSLQSLRSFPLPSEGDPTFTSPSFARLSTARCGFGRSRQANYGSSVALSSRCRMQGEHSMGVIKWPTSSKPRSSTTDQERANGATRFWSVRFRSYSGKRYEARPVPGSKLQTSPRSQKTI